jgi:hypothetical protein
MSNPPREIIWTLNKSHNIIPTVVVVVVVVVVIFYAIFYAIFCRHILFDHLFLSISCHLSVYSFNQLIEFAFFEIGMGMHLYIYISLRQRNSLIVIVKLWHDATVGFGFFKNPKSGVSHRNCEPTTVLSRVERETMRTVATVLKTNKCYCTVFTVLWFSFSFLSSLTSINRELHAIYYCSIIYSCMRMQYGGTVWGGGIEIIYI